MSLFPEHRGKVGVIGLGVIGSRAARVLRDAGFHVHVWNRSPKPQPNFLGSPEEVARFSPVVQIFVAGGEALLAVVRAMRPALGSGHLVIGSTTADPEIVRQAAALVEETGAAFLEAPFAGTREAAEKGALVYFTGGDPRLAERARPVLEATGKDLVHAGAMGEASALKLAAGMVSAATVAILAEAFALVRAAGIDPRRLGEALEREACGSGLAEATLAAMAAGDHAARFSLDNLFADSQAALALARRHRLEAPALSTAASLMFQSIQKGWGGEDCSVLARARVPGS